MYDMIQHIFGSLEVSERAIKGMKKTLRKQSVIGVGLLFMTIGGFVMREMQIRDLQRRVSKLEEEMEKTAIGEVENSRGFHPNDETFTIPGKRIS